MSMLTLLTKVNLNRESTNAIFEIFILIHLSIHFIHGHLIGFIALSQEK